MDAVDIVLLDVEDLKEKLERAENVLRAIKGNCRSVQLAIDLATNYFEGQDALRNFNQR